MLKSKKFFTFVIDFELMFSDLVLLIKSLESFNSFFGDDSFDHRSVFLVISSEVSYIFNKNFDIFFESFEILSLFDS